jgi:hypothetical protein
MAALWIGRSLPAYCAACLASFPAQGHSTTLYSYEPVRGLPPAVQSADARGVVDAAVMERFAQAGTFSQFANHFRYELLAQDDGVCWVDTDMYCLRPVDAEPCVFGWQDGRWINNAILALPAVSPVLRDLRRMFSQEGFIAPWLSWRRMLLHRAKALIGQPIAPEHYRRALLGPEALTWYARRHGLEHSAKPREVFYPLYYLETDRLLDPDFAWTPPRETRTLHLWNEYLRRHRDAEAPPRGSLLWKILQGDPLVESPR